MIRHILSILLLAWSAVVPAYELMGSRWPEAHTTFHPDFQLLGERKSPSGISWNRAFVEAAQQWNRETLFRFDIDLEDPSHPCAGILPKYPEDGFRNGAAFTSVICTTDAYGFPETTGFGANTLAVTMTYTVPGKPELTDETDIFFNNREKWDVYDGPERRLNDFRRVALHELGHALGLDHETRRQAIMAPLVGDLFTLQEDDIRGVAALYGGDDGGKGDLDPIVLRIEDPGQGEVKSGISTFRGWVVSLQPLESLSLYLDGSYKGDLDHKGPRGDVGNRFPDYPGSDRSGFAFAFAYGGLSEGAHQYRLVATDVLGNRMEQKVKFEVVRFDTAYLKDSSRVSLDSAQLSGRGNEILIENLLHDGKAYRVRLRWSRKSQGFEPVEITPQP